MVCPTDLWCCLIDHWSWCLWNRWQITKAFLICERIIGILSNCQNLHQVRALWNHSPFFKIYVSIQTCEMCTYIHACVCTCVCTSTPYTFVKIYIAMHTDTCMYIQMDGYVCMYVNEMPLNKYRRNFIKSASKEEKWVPRVYGLGAFNFTIRYPCVPFKYWLI